MLDADEVETTVADSVGDSAADLVDVMAHQ